MLSLWRRFARERNAEQETVLAEHRTQLSGGFQAPSEQPLLAVRFEPRPRPGFVAHMYFIYC